MAQLGFNPNIQPRIVVNTQTDNTCGEKKENYTASNPFILSNVSKVRGAALFPDTGAGPMDVCAL